MSFAIAEERGGFGKRLLCTRGMIQEGGKGVGRDSDKDPFNYCPEEVSLS